MLAEIITPEFIEDEMRRNSYTPQSLAERLDVSQKCIEFWCDGRRRPSLRSAEGLLDAFGYTVEVRRV